jgi:hypothetical protein
MLRHALRVPLHSILLAYRHRDASLLLLVLRLVEVITATTAIIAIAKPILLVLSNLSQL